MLQISFLRHSIVLGLAIAFHAELRAQQNLAPYKQANLPVDQRVSDLLGRMTLDEKIAQLSHIHEYEIFSNKQLDSVKMKSRLGDRSFGCVEAFTLNGAQCAKAMRAIQYYMVNHTRLGIPIFTVTESLHGSVQDGSTIFPQTVAIGATFNTELAYKMTAAISKELMAQGMRQSLSPGLDVVRDLRWGRVEESFGEDPVLVGEMAIAQVRGYMDNSIAPMLKPIGSAAPSGGLNLASIDCSERDMREIYLKPYEMAVKRTAVKAVMTSYNSWNRIPNSASRWMLTDVLRGEWKFDGYVYSDWAAVSMLKDFQRVAATEEEAAAMALKAGLDLEASSNYYLKIPELLNTGQLQMAEVDTAVARVLKAKFALGLFEKPYGDEHVKYQDAVHRPEAIALSKEMADESIVLLKNEKELLPINRNKFKSIAVIGPNADQVQFGDYTWTRDNKHGVTPLRAITELVGDASKIKYAAGCDLVSGDSTGFAAAVEASKQTDLTLVFVGSSSASLARDYGNATSGEGFDLSDLNLPGVQEHLVKALHRSGKPVVVVLVTGKPFAIPWIKDHIPAIAVQWYGGEKAGVAIADMLFGKTNPSGKLPFSFPRSVGHLPVYYNHLPSDKGYYKRRGSADKPGRDYVFSSPDALWNFGYGLSYTNFSIPSIRLMDTVITTKDTLRVVVNISNTGRQDGKEVVQLYVRNMTGGGLATPIRELKAFSKPKVAAGKTVSITLSLAISDLAIFDENMQQHVREGKYEIQVGIASDSILHRKTIVVANNLLSTKASSAQQQTEADASYKRIAGKAITVKGEIRDVQATPVVGATVRILGANISVKTDKLGAYSIKCTSNDILIITAPGYKELRVPVNGEKSLNLRLQYQSE